LRLMFEPGQLQVNVGGFSERRICRWTDCPTER
jgi:hypothetical protein